MKFTQIPIILAFLVPAITALPAAEADQSANPAELASRAVCANNVCIGVNRNKLCNDRCINCTGPSGKYKSGSCGGILWQQCVCYYSS